MEFGSISFFNNKSIQRSYQFRLSIVDGFNDNSENKYYPDGEILPEIQNYHCLNVTIPNYQWKKEIQYVGVFPRSYQVLNHDGLEINVTLEEDDVHTVQNLINWLQRRIIQSNGLYVPPGQNRLTEIRIDITDAQENVVSSYSFPNAYFLKANDVSFSYSDNESTKFEIIFGSDFQEFESAFKDNKVLSAPPISSLGNTSNIG